MFSVEMVLYVGQVPMLVLPGFNPRLGHNLPPPPHFWDILMLFVLSVSFKCPSYAALAWCALTWKTVCSDLPHYTQGRSQDFFEGGSE